MRRATPSVSLWILSMHSASGHLFGLRWAPLTFVASATLLLAACGQLTWSHPAGPASFPQDAFECNEVGVHANGSDPNIMAALNVECREARGWELH